MTYKNYIFACIFIIVSTPLNAGDLPFIRILDQQVTSSLSAINDLREILYLDNTLSLYSTERGFIASNVTVHDIANNGEIVYGRRVPRDVFSTTRGIIGPGDAPSISPTTGEIAYQRLPDFRIVTTLQGLVDVPDPQLFISVLPDVNDFGEIVMEVRDTRTVFTRIYSTVRGWLTPADSDAHAPAISNTGEVVYFGFDEQGRQQIFSTTRGQITSFGGAYSTTNAANPDIDSFGNVLFFATVNGVDSLYLLPSGPVITAGGGNIQECTQEGGTEVVFTASGPLLTPGETIIDYQWKLDGSSVGSGEQITLFISLGKHVIEAIATTSEGETRIGSADIEIIDTTSPEISTSFTNSKGSTITSISRGGINFVTVNYDANDICDPSPSVNAVGGVSVFNGDVLRINASIEDIIINGDTFLLGVSSSDASGNSSKEEASLIITE